MTRVEWFACLFSRLGVDKPTEDMERRAQLLYECGFSLLNAEVLVVPTPVSFTSNSDYNAAYTAGFNACFDEMLTLYLKVRAEKRKAKTI